MTLCKIGDHYYNLDHVINIAVVEKGKVRICFAPGLDTDKWPSEIRLEGEKASRFLASLEHVARTFIIIS